MKVKKKFTHKGFFMFMCPCYFADMDTESPIIEPIHKIFRPLLLVSISIAHVIMNACETMNPYGDSLYYPMIAKELKAPKIIEIDFSEIS
jgi:hypothetical protein